MMLRPNPVERHGYTEDFVLWALEQAALLRAGRWADLDVEHIAAEMEALSRSDRRRMVEQLGIVLAHFLAWQFRPQERQESWMQAIRDGRLQVERLIAGSPSLRRDLGSFLVKAYPDACRMAAAMTGLPPAAFPDACPYPVGRVLDPDFLPA